MAHYKNNIFENFSDEKFEISVNSEKLTSYNDRTQEARNVSTELVPEKTIIKEDFQKILAIINNSQIAIHPNDNLFVRFNCQNSLSKEYGYNYLLGACPNLGEILKNMECSFEGKVKF